LASIPGPPISLVALSASGLILLVRGLKVRD
jgi:hypothetical protein